jgi:hypothetical protein
MTHDDTILSGDNTILPSGNATLSGDNTILSGACTLDHDGCVVCSDAGIPLRMIALHGDDAAGARAQIAVELVAPVRIGDILLTHGGVAIGRVLEAQRDEVRL